MSAAFIFSVIIYYDGIGMDSYLQTFVLLLSERREAVGPYAEVGCVERKTGDF